MVLFHIQADSIDIVENEESFLVSGVDGGLMSSYGWSTYWQVEKISIPPHRLRIALPRKYPVVFAGLAILDFGCSSRNRIAALAGAYHRGNLRQPPTLDSDHTRKEKLPHLVGSVLPPDSRSSRRPESQAARHRAHSFQRRAAPDWYRDWRVEFITLPADGAVAWVRHLHGWPPAMPYMTGGCWIVH